MDANLLEKLNQDLKQSLRSGEKTKVSVIRLIISAAHYQEMARQAPLSDSDIIGVIAHEAKQRDESILAFKQGNRPDLVAKEEEELVILKTYLPQQLTHDEILAEVKKIIAETGAQGMKDKGKVMQKLMPAMKGKADGREVNTIVEELLKS
jgi:uncharacterized protein